MPLDRPDHRNQITGFVEAAEYRLGSDSRVAARAAPQLRIQAGAP